MECASDEELVRSCSRGDGEAWAELIRRYRRLIYSIPVAYRFSSDLADDVFQRVAIKLLENLPRLRRAAALTSWIGTVTRHECQSLARERRRHADDDAASFLENVESPPEDVVRDLHAVECEHALQLALARIGEPCQGLLRALYIEDPTPSYEEIAGRLGRPIGSLGPTRARCLAKLQKLYRTAGGPEPDFSPG